MGLFDKKNIDKAKDLAEKNKQKIASGVSKATDTIDKKTGGKHTDKLKKVDDVAKKYAGPPAGAPADAEAPEAATESTADAESTESTAD